MLAVLVVGLIVGTLVPAGNGSAPSGADLPPARPFSRDATAGSYDDEEWLSDEEWDEASRYEDWEDDLALAAGSDESWDDFDPTDDGTDDAADGGYGDGLGDDGDYWPGGDEWSDDWSDDWYENWWPDDETDWGGDPWATTTTTARAPAVTTTTTTTATTTTTVATSTTTVAPTTTRPPVTTTTTVPIPRTGGWCDPAAVHRTSTEPVAVIENGTCLRTEPVRPAAGQTLEDAVAAARRRPGVRSVGVPSTVRVSSAGTPVPDPLRPEQWALDALRAGDLGPRPTRPTVSVGVLDTGVDAGHPDLAGAVAPGYDALGPGDGRTDGNGHGTLVAGVIGAVADNGIGIAGFGGQAVVVPVRVLATDGTGSSLDVVAGIDWAVRNGVRVLDLSLATNTADEHLRVAVERAWAAGVVVVAAAGNHGAAGNPPGYPAAFDGVIAVAAVDRALEPAGFSTRGTYLTLAAPGSDVLSTWRGGRYARAGGTSLAAAHVAAAVAVLLADGADPAKVRTLLARTATDLGPAGVDPATGAGLLDLVAARRLVPSPTTTATPATSVTTTGTTASPLSTTTRRP